MTETEERVERVISECRRLDVEPSPEAVAQIMVDQDMYLMTDDIPPEETVAFTLYRKAAALSLLRSYSPGSGSAPRRP
ncbi:MAG TPA: hypothetical protein VH281_03905 [Gaiellaceae bacterium]|jgi:hypothetical protein